MQIYVVYFSNLSLISPELDFSLFVANDNFHIHFKVGVSEIFFSQWQYWAICFTTFEAGLNGFLTQSVHCTE